jgi:hypothetical protein
MSWRLITSFVLLTGGAGIIGVALAQLMRGRVRGNALASDLLIGAGIILAGMPDEAAGAALHGVALVGLALVTSGTLLHLRGMRDTRSERLPSADRRHDNSLDRRS